MFSIWENVSYLKLIGVMMGALRSSRPARSGVKLEGQQGADRLFGIAILPM